MSNHRKISAQVATEAIINDSQGYDVSTVEAVLDEARVAGVASLYVEMLEAVLERMSS